MKRATTHRQLWLGAALLLTLAATAYVWIQDGKTADKADLGVATIAPQTAKPIVAKQAIAQAPASPLPTRALQEASRDIFALPAKKPEPEPKKNIPPPPPPPPVHLPVLATLPVAPAPPAAPPLPFTYIGKLGEAGQYTVFLSARGKNYAVKAGDFLEQIYRIDSINPPVMRLTYLPLNMKQTMQIGEGK